MADIPKTNQENFPKDVLQAELPVLVDFSAVWCNPCKMLDPIVEQLAADWNGKVKVVKLDVDENPDLAYEFQVMGVPTLLLFKGGQPVERVTGYAPRERLEKRFLHHLT